MMFLKYHSIYFCEGFVMNNECINIFSIKFKHLPYRNMRPELLIFPFYVFDKFYKMMGTNASHFC